MRPAPPPTRRPRGERSVGDDAAGVEGGPTGAARDELPDDNPVARLLSARACGSPAGLAVAYFLLPALLTWIALPGGVQGRPNRQHVVFAYLVAVPLPTVVLFFYQFEWHFNRLIARLRAMPVASELLLTRLTMEDILGGVVIAAQRHAIRDRLALVLGALASFALVLWWARGEPIMIVAQLPVPLLLVVYLSRARDRARRRRMEADSPRVHAATLALLANRGSVSAFLVTLLEPLAIASFVAMIWNKWAGLAGVAAVLVALLALGSWLSRARLVEQDDPFATAFRRHLRTNRVPGRRVVVDDRGGAGAP